MSDFRCDKCDENYDSDNTELYEMGSLNVCEHCFEEIEI